MTKRKKPAHGGAREGAGRPAIDPSERKRPVTVWLSPVEIAHCKKLGGTTQEGLRQLVFRSMRKR